MNIEEHREKQEGFLFHLCKLRRLGIVGTVRGIQSQYIFGQYTGTAARYRNA